MMVTVQWCGGKLLMIMDRDLFNNLKLIVLAGQRKGRPGREG